MTLLAASISVVRYLRLPYRTPKIRSRRLLPATESTLRGQCHDPLVPCGASPKSRDGQGWTTYEHRVPSKTCLGKVFGGCAPCPEFVCLNCSFCSSASQLFALPSGVAEWHRAPFNLAVCNLQSPPAAMAPEQSPVPQPELIVRGLARRVSRAEPR